MSWRAFCLPALCLALFITIGCGGEPPEKEMQQAQGALDTALAAGADTYAKEEFAAAQQALANAKAAVEQRDYRLALNHALDSRERAGEAARQAGDNKAAARAAAERALDSAGTALNEARSKLATAESRRVAPRALSGPRTAIDTAHVGLQEARATFDKGNYLEVPNRVKAATASLSASSEQLDTLLTPPGRRRR
jgi:hypothetical protein